MKWFLHHAKRIIRISAGVGVILIGMGLGFVPGIPGFPLVLLGLSILAIDFVWAHRLKTKMHDTARSALDKVRGKKKQP
jgi:hypothetical protein